MTAAADLSVDIVINNYNYGAFLGAAIESARAQTHEKTRVIVVDDGSSDDSDRVLREHEAELDAVVRKPNGGQASALNAGFEHCRGDVVMFLDADDVLHPSAAGSVAAVFAADERVAKVQFRAAVIDAAGGPTGVLKPAAHLPMPSGDLTGAELARPYDLVWMSTSANAFRASALGRVLPIPEDSYRICADWYLVHMTALLGRVVSLDAVEVSYRLHGANSYEPQKPSLDLDHLRQTMVLARRTSAALLELAAALELPRPQRILSLADLANRIVSLKLEPELHPIAGDSLHGLVLDSVRAGRRRDDVSAAMKVLFVGWFAALALSPRPLARRLAVLFLFPGSRAGLNRLLGRLHRPGHESDPAAS
jgi:glycosyltransferase involved in cell wall biosynthesis